MPAKDGLFRTLGRGCLLFVGTTGYLLALPLLILVQLLQPRRRDTLIWGPVPILNNKFWSAAMREAGWKSLTLMSTYYSSINRREDFDLYFGDLVPWPRRSVLVRFLGPLLAHLYVARHASVVHIPFSGGALGHTPLWRIEAWLYRMSGIKTVVVPYGADIYRYSRIPDPSVRHALLVSYPVAARREHLVERRVAYWIRHADVIITGFTLEGLGRWDVPTGNIVCIDVGEWQLRPPHTDHDGRNGPVSILHAPNHRGAKGTEFLIQAVERLKVEGLDVRLILVEGMQNERVRESMNTADILADQFILPGYGLSAIEGMAKGLPVLCNLHNEAYAGLFRRYSFLDECPVVSTTPESLTDTLRRLVVDPELRAALGRAGREFAEKYQSYEAAQYLFGSIYRKILKNEDVDLMNLFHPLKSPYNRKSPPVSHPLKENRLPPGAPTQC